MKSKPYILVYVANKLNKCTSVSIAKENIQALYKYSKVMRLGYVYVVKAFLSENKVDLKLAMSEFSEDNIIRVELWINNKGVAVASDNLIEFIEDLPNIKKTFTDGK